MIGLFVGVAEQSAGTRYEGGSKSGADRACRVPVVRGDHPQIRPRDAELFGRHVVHGGVGLEAAHLVD